MLTVGYTTVHGAEWVYFNKTLSGDYYYDKESITSGGKGIVKVWEKQIYSEKGKQDYIRQLKEKGIYDTKLEDLSYSVDLHTIKCSTREFNVIYWVHRNSEEEIIDSCSGPSPSYNQISPESIIESLYKILCKGR